MPPNSGKHSSFTAILLTLLSALQVTMQTTSQTFNLFAVKCDRPVYALHTHYIKEY